MPAPWEVDDTAITPTLLDALRHVESRGNPNAVSPAGARGPYQFMPGTAKQYGLANPHDEPTARSAAARYLTDLTQQFGGDVNKALLAYNWGPGNVNRYLKTGGPMPAEAQQYVGKVRAAEKNMSGKEATPWEVDDTVGKETAPWTTDDTKAPLGKRATISPVAAEAKKMVEEDTGQALKAGIALTASKVARAVNHLLPQAISDFAEKHGFMPSEKDVEILKQSIADSTAGKTANITTEIAATALPAARAARLAEAAPVIRAATPGIRNVVGGAAAGATGNAAIDEDIGQGALFGGVAAPFLSVLGKGANYAVGGIQDIVGGAQGAAVKKLRDVFGADRVDAAVAALRNTQGIVPGEAPTVGRAASETLPEFKVFEEAARRQPGANQLLMQDAQNAATRQNVLEGMAQGSRPGVATQRGAVPQSPNEAFRTSVVDPLYEASRAVHVPVTPDLGRILEAPLLNTAVRNARQTYAQSAANAGVPRRVPAGTISHDELQMVRRNISDEIRQLPPGRERIELNNARQEIEDTLRRTSPDYAEAQTQFRVLSEPQNQGEVADAMLRKLRGGPNVKEDIPAFLGSMEDAPKTIKNALGESRYQQLEQVMTPQQMAEINALRQSAEREARYAALDVPATVVEKYKSVFDTIADNTPGVFQQGVTILRAFAKRLGRRSDAEVQRVVNGAVSDPAEFARLLESLPPQERNAAINAIRRIGAQPETKGAIIGTVAPSLSEE
jgi:hypothetical protein